MTWVGEFPIAWVIDGRRVQGRIAIGMPQIVEGEDQDGEGHATCTVVLDGLQPRTTVNGEGRLHALLVAVRFLDARLRDHIAKGVRAVFPGDLDDPEEATQSLLAMFTPFE